MKLQKIQDNENYKKDLDSGAVISVDKRGLEAYRARKSSNKVIIEEINSIKSDLLEIKEIIGKLVK